MSDLKKANSASFIERVVSFIKGDDDAKVRKFQKRAISNYEITVKALEREIETLEHKLSDARDVQNDALLNVDISMIGSVESIDRYSESYITAQFRYDDQMKAFETEIQAKKDKIAKIKAVIAKMA